MARPVKLFWSLAEGSGCAEAVLFWKPEGGEEVRYATVARGVTVTQETFPGHVWVLRSAATHEELLRATAGAEAAQHLVYPAVGATSSASGEVTLVISVPQTHAAATVAVFWKDGGDERHYADVPRGASVRQTTFAGHTWVFRDKASSQLLGSHTATAQGSQEVTVSSA